MIDSDRRPVSNRRPLLKSASTDVIISNRSPILRYSQLGVLTKLSLQLFFMANFDRVNRPIDMRVWKRRRFENILKLDCDLR
jgi:hypothetical protein